MHGESFVDFVLDQLQHLVELDCHRMFSGYGLYHNGVFFGIVANSRLYFKTNATTRAGYLDRGMDPFRPNAKQTLWTYYEVPVEILEDRDELTAWAKRAVACQLTEGKSTSGRG